MAWVEPNTEQEHNKPTQFVTQKIIMFLDIQMSRNKSLHAAGEMVTTVTAATGFIASMFYMLVYFNTFVLQPQTQVWYLTFDLLLGCSDKKICFN